MFQSPFPPHPPVEATVRCQGHLHWIQWTPRGLRLLDHPTEELAFLRAMQVPCRCLAVLRAYQDKTRYDNMVPALWRARHQYKTEKKHLGHASYFAGQGSYGFHRQISRLLERALTRRFRPMLDAIHTAGL
jgi:hypothetical protein